MVSGKQGIKPRFGPSNRILDLAQHKTSKTVWATTPCEKLNWGNQEPIWPVTASALGAGPSPRIQYLSRHKRDFSAWEDHRRHSFVPNTTCNGCDNSFHFPAGKRRRRRGRRRRASSGRPSVLAPGLPSTSTLSACQHPEPEAAAPRKRGLLTHLSVRITVPSGTSIPK
ncbi:hypothetical protein D9C73_006889 [Collichthys lucidus]|uniref:Uncharacterized protein n=1 Tax=Collichthys lucidus TaxID=240159 RepID=A0A4V6ARB0_COLLU|nr:hypothetical protein D9C73_006889 [Collichthys lucidus]